MLFKARIWLNACIVCTQCYIIIIAQAAWKPCNLVFFFQIGSLSSRYLGFSWRNENQRHENLDHCTYEFICNPMLSSIFLSLQLCKLNVGYSSRYCSILCKLNVGYSSRYCSTLTL